MSRDMLNRWAASQSDRRVIEEFWEWLESHDYKEQDVSDIDITRTLDEYHEIDRAQLDRERRDLLSANAGGHIPPAGPNNKGETMSKTKNAWLDRKEESR